MRLLTHNYLQSNVKGTEKGYPLSIEAIQVVDETSPVDIDMVKRLIPKLEYSAVLKARQQLMEICESSGIHLPELPNELPEEIDDELATNLYRILFDIHVLEGNLVCPDTGRKFPVKEGIPNMILHEDEL